jgi:hypothetical protein
LGARRIPSDHAADADSLRFCPKRCWRAGRPATQHGQQNGSMRWTRLSIGEAARTAFDTFVKVPASVASWSVEKQRAPLRRCRPDPSLSKKIGHREDALFFHPVRRATALGAGRDGEAEAPTASAISRRLCGLLSLCRRLLGRFLLRGLLRCLLRRFLCCLSQCTSPLHGEPRIGSRAYSSATCQLTTR